MNRLAYLIWWLILLGAGTLIALLTVIGAAVVLAVSGGSFVAAGVFLVPMGVIILVYVWISIMFVIKRVHDMGYSGGWVLLFYILAFVLGITGFVIELLLDSSVMAVLANLLGLAFMLLLFFKKGTAGDNRYGPDPLAVK
ncbi:MAG: DUF805 domain-containing protein [Alphaproteobacteria bacterium]|nr:DUF805 domain-containing protein [Alphaproteobacteria bacterium]